MDNLEFLRGVGFGKDVDTIDDKPIETIPGVKSSLYSEEVQIDPAMSEAADIFLKDHQGAPPAEAEDLAPAEVEGAKEDIVSVGAYKASAIIDVPATDFNAATIPVGTGATKLVDGNDGRLAITIYNPPGGGTLFIGRNASVGTGYSSFPLLSGNSLTMAVRSEIWVRADAAGSVAYLEYLI